MPRLSQSWPLITSSLCRAPTPESLLPSAINLLSETTVPKCHYSILLQHSKGPPGVKVAVKWQLLFRHSARGRTLPEQGILEKENGIWPSNGETGSSTERQRSYEKDPVQLLLPQTPSWEKLVENSPLFQPSHKALTHTHTPIFIAFSSCLHDCGC